jgi:hypothetical protein
VKTISKLRLLQTSVLSKNMTDRISIEMNSIEDIVDASEIMKTSENRRTFEYNLNDKAAKAKLLKGAKREAFEVVKNQTSCNLVFSVGGWNHLVLPTIQYWNQIKGGKSCTVGTMIIKVIGVKTGTDSIGKHVDTQVIFFANRDKIVCHFYNTTQLILMNGHGYVKFVEQFLAPYFVSKTQLYEGDIVNYNNLVLETLGSKKVKRSDIKYKRGSTFPCIKCDFAAKTNAALEKHKKNTHAISFIASFTSPSTSMALPGKAMTSTRDNSINVLNEDISLFGLPDDSSDFKEKVTLEETILPVSMVERPIKDRFHCFICQAGFKDLTQLSKHEKIHDPLIDEQNRNNPDKIIDENLSVKHIQHNCIVCSFQCSNSLALEEHIQLAHYTKDVKFKCDCCNYEFSSEIDLSAHVASLYTKTVKKPEEIKCRKCSFKTVDNSDLDVKK